MKWKARKQIKIKIKYIGGVGFKINTIFASNNLYVHITENILGFIQQIVEYPVILGCKDI